MPKRQKDKQRYTKTGVKLRFSERVSSSCCTSGTPCITDNAPSKSHPLSAIVGQIFGLSPGRRHQKLLFIIWSCGIEIDKKMLPSFISCMRFRSRIGILLAARSLSQVSCLIDWRIHCCFTSGEQYCSIRDENKFTNTKLCMLFIWVPTVLLSSPTCFIIRLRQPSCKSYLRKKKGS